MISWKINKIETSSHESMSNVLMWCEWECTYKTESVYRRSYGRLRLCHESIAPESFIEYDQLQESIVIEWVKQHLGQYQVDEIIDSNTNTGMESVEEDWKDNTIVWPANW